MISFVSSVRSSVIVASKVICGCGLITLFLVGSGNANAGFLKDALKDIKEATGEALDTIKQGKEAVQDVQEIREETVELIQQIQYQDTYTPTKAEVLRLQARLNSLGYDAGDVDGALGGGTRTAIKEFQQQNGLRVDGAISQVVLQKIYSSNVAAQVREGLAKAEWREIQVLLNNNGYKVGVADGIPGKKTYAALNAYIAANEISHLAYSERLVFEHLRSDGVNSDRTAVQSQVSREEEVTLGVVQSVEPLEQISGSAAAGAEQDEIVGATAQNAGQVSAVHEGLTPRQASGGRLVDTDCDSISDLQQQSACQLTKILSGNKQVIYDDLFSRLSEDKKPGFAALENHWLNGLDEQCFGDHSCVLGATQKRLAELSGLYQPVAMDSYLLKAQELENSIAPQAVAADKALSRDVDKLVYDCTAETDSRRQQLCMVGKTFFDSIITGCQDDEECVQQRVVLQFDMLKNIYDFPDLTAYRETIDRKETLKNSSALQQVGAQGDTATNIFGVWYGNTSCKSNRKSMDMEVELTLDKPKNGVFNLGLVANHENSMSSGVIKTLYVGEPVSDSAGSIRFVVKKAIGGRYSGINMESFVFDTSSGQIEFAETGCGGFGVELQTENTDRMKPTLSVAAGGGSYWLADNKRARCEILIEWADRVNKEFPDRDFYRSNRPGDYLKTIKVFGDNDFVPVFGAPYDQMSLDRRKKINQFATRSCTKDPFTQSRMTTYRAIADRVMPGNPQRELATNGYSSAVFAIRKMRLVRNQISRLTAGGSFQATSDFFPQQEKQLLELKASTSANSGILWPSERKNLDDQIDRELHKLALANSETVLLKLASIDEPFKGLEASYIGAAEAGRNTYLKYLRGSEKTEFLGKISEMNAGFARQLVEPVLGQLEEIPTTVEGLLEVKALSDKPLPHAGLIEAPYKRHVAQRYAKEIDSRIETLVDTMLMQLPEFTADRAGVKGSALWGTRFSRQFEVFTDSATVKAAQANYLSHRTDLLEKSIDRFEIELGSVASDAEIDALLADYLSWERDEEIPVALEYQFLAEVSR